MITRRFFGLPEHRALTAVALPILAFLAATLAACASKPPAPSPITCVIETSTKLNPSYKGRPSPLLLRFYALKSAAAFNSADFIALYQHDATDLGADIAAKDEYTLAPGETRSCTRILPPDTHFVGVVGAFFDIEHATWRATAPVESGKRATVVVHVDPLGIQLSVSAPPP